MSNEGRVHYCDTESFWRAMCQPEFVRVTLKTGRMRGELYVVDAPPESINGFLADKIAETRRMLNGARPWWRFWA